jgi:predicted ATPase
VSHPFGNLLSQHLHRKHGLSQSKLAAGILQDPSIITVMCKGQRLTGPQARERVVAIIGWLNEQGVLSFVAEANALLDAAGLAPLRAGNTAESSLLQQLDQPNTPASPRHHAQERRVSLPIAPTPFIGRNEDLATIMSHLDDAHCRILTLAGPGGVGKTRLAVEAASRREEVYADGVCFVNLQPVSEFDSLPTAIADALQVALSGGEAPAQQLQRYLANKHILLVLDNFDHLLAGAALIVDLLTAAPHAQLLITSREVLNLREEWQYSVGGIETPPAGWIGNDDDLLAFDAVRLFVDCARRSQHDFSLQSNGEAVARICQLTEGLPLAIELAAAWIKILSCADIAQELEQDLTILTSKLRNAPARHSSMQAVFDQSWRLLSADEREVFARLTVFRGGFTRDAAMQVAGASLATLSSLVDKSFLRSAPDGRHHIHELLRQYGEERLNDSPAIRDETQQRHGSYYTSFLEQQASLNRPSIGNHLESLPLCKSEMDNLRAAWRWAVARCDCEALERAAVGLYWLCQLQSRYLEGYEALDAAIQCLTKSAEEKLAVEALMEMSPYLAWFALRLGRIEQAEMACNRWLALQHEHGMPLRHAWGNDPMSILSIIAAIRGNYTQAEEMALTAIHTARTNPRLLNLPVASYVWANAVLAQGRLDEAHAAIVESIETCRLLHEEWFIAYAFTTLGSIEFTRGNLSAAGTQYESAFAVREACHDAEGMAVALNKLGDIALAESDAKTARARYERSLALYRDLNDLGGLATVRKGLGDLALIEGLHDLAAQHFDQAMHIACEIHYVPLIFSLLVSASDLFLCKGQQDIAHFTLALVLHHPASDHASKERANRLLEQHNMPLPQPISDADWQQLLTETCELTIKHLHGDL